MRRRRFLVTGASRGIGRAIAEALSADGHDVVGLARYPDSAFPGELRQVDLADAAALEAALAGLAEEHFDGVVNNVGSVHPAALDDAEWASLEAAMRLNLGCPSPKPHPSCSEECRGPSIFPQAQDPAPGLKLGRPRSLDHRPCTVTPESRWRTGSGRAGRLRWTYDA